MILKGDAVLSAENNSKNFFLSITIKCFGRIRLETPIWKRNLNQKLALSIHKTPENHNPRCPIASITNFSSIVIGFTHIQSIFCPHFSPPAIPFTGSGYHNPGQPWILTIVNLKPWFLTLWIFPNQDLTSFLIVLWSIVNLICFPLQTIKY